MKSIIESIEMKIIYTPENWDTEENDGKEGYTFMDFLNLAKGDYCVARIIYDLCEWQHPETVLEELLREGELKYEDGKYRILNQD